MTAQSADRPLASVGAFTDPDLSRALADAGATVEGRRSDWGLSKSRRLLAAAYGGMEAAWHARRSPGLVLVTAGLEVYGAALVARLWPGWRGRRLVVADFLVPSSRKASGVQSWLLRRVDGYACIRRGDVATLAEWFGIDPGRCVFTPFPLSPSAVNTAPQDSGPGPRGGYVYAGGTAHRDWATVIDALRRCGLPAVLATDGGTCAALSARGIPDGVEVLADVPPAAGRHLASEATVIVVALQDTQLPAGPLVLLDAMAMGKPIVATDANGNRDYVIDGQTARVVPVQDAPAMAEALTSLWADPTERERLGRAAQQAVAEFTVERFAAATLALLRRS